MNNVNKTLYIPLFGKAYVSKKGIILRDESAEKIWDSVAFPLQGKAKSKWLAYYMGMRARVFDEWVSEEIRKLPDAVIIHLGCGLDSRVLRVGTRSLWYDVDFPEVIRERRKFYTENESYKMIFGDARDSVWLDELPASDSAIIVMEGISMYLDAKEIVSLFRNLGEKFERVRILADFYTAFAAKASKYKNPVNSVGVTTLYGIDTPEVLTPGTSFTFVSEHEMTPMRLIDELSGIEKSIFKSLYGGRMSKKLYKLYEFKR